MMFEQKHAWKCLSIMTIKENNKKYEKDNYGYKFHKSNYFELKKMPWEYAKHIYTANSNSHIMVTYLQDCTKLWITVWNTNMKK